MCSQMGLLTPLSQAKATPAGQRVGLNVPSLQAGRSQREAQALLPRRSQIQHVTPLLLEKSE